MVLLGLFALISTSVSAQLTVGNYFRYNGFVYQVDAMATATTGSVSVAAIQTGATPIDASGKLNLIGVIDDNFLGEHIVLTVTHIQANALRTCANPAFNAAAIGTTTAFPEDKIVTVKKVEIPAQFTQVLATTFEGYTNIDEITFATGSQLNLVESHAFTTTQAKEFDFSPCTLLYNLADEAFVKSNTTPNNYITKITLPDHSADATMTRFSFGENLTVGGGIVSANGTALSYLPKLATIVNLDKCNLRQIKANAFNGDASLTSLEVPATVNLINDGAFANSGIKNLTIKVDNLGATLTYDVNGTPTATPGSFGQGTCLYGATPELLESLTLKGELNTTIAANAFAGCVNLTNLDMINMSFKETTTTPAVVGAGAFAANSFANCASLTSVMIPVIKGNGAAGTVIAGGAFAGCTALDDVNITGIKTDAGAVAVGLAAFGNALKTVTIGTIEVAATTNAPIAAGAFVYGDVSGATLKIATGASQYLNNSGAVDLIAAGAFDFSAITVTPARTEADYPTVQIGQINSGAIFAEQALKGNQIMSIAFKGSIANAGLDGFTTKPIIQDNTGVVAGLALKELTFEGNLGTGTTAAAVIGANAFAGLPNLETITFGGDIIPGAIASGAFNFTGSAVAKVTITFNGDLKATTVSPVILAGAFEKLPATSEIHYTKSDATTVANPFAATAFDNAAVVGTPRDIVLVVSDAALAALYADGTTGLSTGLAFDIFRVIASAAPVVTTSLNVYVNNSNPAQAWARDAVTATAGNFKAITRVQTIDGVGEVKVTLYGTYADEDPYEKQSTVYMVPLKAIGGVYYIGGVNTETLIAKVEKTDGTTFAADFAIPMVDLTAAAAATAQQVITAASSIWTGLTNDKLHIAGNIMTNQDLCDGNAVDSRDGFTAGAELYRWIDNTVKTDIVRNIYFMTDPSKHNGFRVKLTEINRTNSNYIGTGNYYMLLAKFNSDTEARVIWLGEDENVTAILGVKKNVKSVDNDAVYTLQGVRVDEIQKGHVYIKNGKKFIAQ